jgi:pimeloyl-ACP methyl ester carboxylesterase
MHSLCAVFRLCLLLVAVLKNSQLMFLDRCGHFPWLEQPEEFYNKIHAFLKVGLSTAER